MSALPINPRLTVKLCTFKRVRISGSFKIFLNNTFPVAKPPNSTSSNRKIFNTYCTSILFKSTIQESVSSFVIFPSTNKCCPGRSNKKLSIYIRPESTETWEERICQIVSFNMTFVGKISISHCNIGLLPSV